VVANSPGWFSSLTNARVVAGVPAEATGVEHDSRRVVPGCVFVAIAGVNFDGHRFVGDAVQRGAAAVIAQEGAPPLGESPSTAPCIVLVPDTRIALAEAAAGFYGHPARSLGMVGVTGTDGKTTTTHLIAHVLNATGHPAGYLSSVEFGLPQSAELNASHMTTLEANEVQRHLAACRDAGARYAVVEASSIGLDMHRVDQCEFDVGVFTNLTQDHLDYHGTMENYRWAKAKLFRMVDQSIDKGFAKCAVVNGEDHSAHDMASQTRHPELHYAVDGRAVWGGIADILASVTRVDERGTVFQAAFEGCDVEARTPLLGDFNVSNCLAAIGVAVSQGMSFKDAVAALATFRGVPGRMEIIDEGQPFRVIVDIASTEQAMRNVLRVLRAATKGGIIVVFGAAGERDVERRSGIARAVAEAADAAVITNEDPRSESPSSILDEIAIALRGCGWRDGDQFTAIEDRREAIAHAFALAKAGDTVLLAGKGTEQSIVIGTTHHPWDERAVARELLRERFGV
jgi:UDP-N-acetylmuramoyl-L-alanyl-D-glutamate--2,6-diaminopimelate ligase